jgi:hypothetical protein
MVAGAAAFFTKDYLAPANNFWRHTPTAVTLGVAVILAIISGMGVPFADWLSVITLATLIGLPAGRILSKFIVR